MKRIKEKNEKLIREFLTTKSKSSFDKLVANNLRLVSFVMHLVNVSSNRREDYFDVGEIGLLKAINLYDESYLDKCSFTTFAVACIKNEIFNQYRSEADYFETLSLDYTASSEDGERDNFASVVSMKQYLSVDNSDAAEEFIDREYKEYIKKVVYEVLKEKFDERDKEIIIYYFGLEGETLSHAQLASKYGVTRSEIFRRYKRVMEKVRERLESTYEDGDLKIEKKSCKKGK